VIELRAVWRVRSERALDRLERVEHLHRGSVAGVERLLDRSLDDRRKGPLRNAFREQDRLGREVTRHEHSGVLLVEGVPRGEQGDRDQAERIEVRGGFRGA
jgi:hypothetical protein